MACFFNNIGAISSALVSAKFFLIVLTIFFGFSSVTNAFGSHEFPTKVILRNELSPNITLTYHCKSADDDLGERSLAFKGEWLWSFFVNFWDTTLFWCNFWWVEDNGNPRHESFQIYKAKRDMRRCGAYCWRLVRSDGIYGLTGGGESYLLHKWPSS
ncbi:hypothetical protein MKW94_003816 [Papaver nudicaule]|uniref:S-protein homolog n=1 Tax=Papaver nudicaule TaxID=74823 RepID=A0AA41VSJ5_PAPNU|nr:hypothetical protein [Papaver nudicaule]